MTLRTSSMNTYEKLTLRMRPAYHAVIGLHRTCDRNDTPSNLSRVKGNGGVMDSVPQKGHGPSGKVTSQ